MKPSRILGQQRTEKARAKRVGTKEESNRRMIRRKRLAHLLCMASVDRFTLGLHILLLVDRYCEKQLDSTVHRPKQIGIANGAEGRAFPNSRTRR
jgi:hypothetical protein